MGNVRCSSFEIEHGPPKGKKVGEEKKERKKMVTLFRTYRQVDLDMVCFRLVFVISVDVSVSGNVRT